MPEDKYKHESTHDPSWDIATEESEIPAEKRELDDMKRLTLDAIELLRKAEFIANNSKSDLAAHGRALGSAVDTLCVLMYGIISRSTTAGVTYALNA